MNKIIISVTVLLFTSFVVSCGHKEKSVNPLWGLWIQVEPETVTKSEVMFNEDSTGFVFNADTLVCETRWLQNDKLKVNFFLNPSDNGITKESVYSYTVIADTLVLNDDSSATSTRYLRVKE